MPDVKGACLILFLATLFAAVSAAAQDVVTVGTGAAAATGSVNIPVFIRDISGTPLGIDQPVGSRIQSYSLKVDYSPTSAVQSVSFTRGGVTASLTPTFESSPSAAGTISLLDVFQESTNPIPFTVNAAAPGNQMALLHFTLSASATPGSAISVTLDPTLTQLTDEAGNPATKETVANTNLQLVGGSINVAAPAPVPVPALSIWAIGLLAVTVVILALRKHPSPGIPR